MLNYFGNKHGKQKYLLVIKLQTNFGQFLASKTSRSYPRFFNLFYTALFMFVVAVSCVFILS